MSRPIVSCVTDEGLHRAHTPPAQSLGSSASIATLEIYFRVDWFAGFLTFICVASLT
jgi:hypothetical protein